MVHTPLALFDCSIKGWRNNNKPENRKARLPLLNPALFEAMDPSKRKCAEVLTTAKTFKAQEELNFFIIQPTVNFAKNIQERNYSLHHQ